MTVVRSISVKNPSVPIRIPNPQLRIRYRRRSQLRIRSSLDDIFRTLTSSNPRSLIPAAITLASGAAALYLTRNRVSGLRPEAVIADWILFTSPTPFNRGVLLRCPSISFEDGEESEKLLTEEKHYVNLSRGRILAREARSEEWEEIGYQRTCVRTEDGGVISLDCPENLDLGREYGLDTTVLIVPGTAEGSMDPDVKKFVADALRSGCFPVVMNPRGCAGSPLTTARLFTAADSDDICTAVKYINRSRPWTTLMGVGWGYGANMLTKYLAEVGEATPLTAAVCIDNPFDLEEATRSLRHHVTMDQKLTGGLVDILRANKELFQGKTKGFDLAKGLSATSVRDFDKAVSMISYGFHTIEEFYSMSSTRELVKKLKVPVLFIQSDDGTVPSYSVPRIAIAENPFTSLLLCTCYPSFIDRVERSAILWCHQLTIEWLSAVELALLKGRHPLLKDVDITINPSKGSSFTNDEASEETIAVQNRSHGIYDTPRWFLSHRNANNDSLLDTTPSNSVNGFLMNQFGNEEESPAYDKLNSNSKSASDLSRTEKGDVEMREDENVSASQPNLIAGVGNPHDTEGSQVLQTAAVVMNMLDVTMPGTLNDEQKKKVLTAMEQGETLRKALEGAVPDEVRGKLTTAVTEILQSQGTNLNFDGLRRIGWIYNVASGKSKNQEKSKEVSVTKTGEEGGQEEVHSSDQRKTGIRSDEKIQETTESAPINSEPSQEKIAQASAHAAAGTEADHKASQPDKLEEAIGGIDETNREQHKVNQGSGKDDEHFVDKQDKKVLNDGNDAQNSDMEIVDAPTEQNMPTSTNSDESLSAGSTNSEHIEKKETDIQKNENKISQDVGDQNAQDSTEPEEHTPQCFSSKPPPISVAQALDALTGMDDSTQMAVNSVFGVLEGMIDQFEKTSNQEDGDDRKDNENHETVNKSGKEDNSNNKFVVESDETEPSNHPESNPKKKEKTSFEEGQGSLKKVSCDLTSSVKNSITLVEGSRVAFKNIDSGRLNKVGDVHNFSLDVAGTQYWKSPYAAYLDRCFITQMPTMKPVDFESATDLFLDPEEGQWRMVDQSGYTKNNLSEGGEKQRINGRDQLKQINDMDNIVEPSYVILENEYSNFENGLAEEHNAADDKNNDDKEEPLWLIKNTLLGALKIEVSRKLGKSEQEGLERDLISDLEQFAVKVSWAVVHDSGLNYDSFSQSSMKFGKTEAKHIVETISSAALGASHLRKVLPLGVIVGSSLAALRTYFHVVSLHHDDQNEAIHKPRHVKENYHRQGNETKKGISGNEKDQQIALDKTIEERHQVLQTDNLNSGGIMVGAVTAALGASALLAHHEKEVIYQIDKEIPSSSFNEKDSSQQGDAKLAATQENNENNLVGSLAEKALSVAGPVVPTKIDGEVDQERLVAILAELGQKGGILRFFGKAALLWGGIRGAVSLTDRLISFFRIAERPLSHRVLGFACMALVLWSPIVIPLLPAIVQCWTTNTSNDIVTFACIAGLYVAITILIILWGKRIRGYEDPLQQYGLEFTSTSRIHDLIKGLVGGTMMVLCIHSINALLGYARLSLPGLPSPSDGASAMFKAYGNMLLLVARGATSAIGIVAVEELLFRSWLAEEIAADLGYYQAILISGLAFSLSQRFLTSVPGLMLLSLAMFGMKQRTQGSLSGPIGMRAGIMITNFILQSGGFFAYQPGTPIWLANTHPWRPFEGLIGLGSCAVLAFFFHPKPLETKDT